MLRQLSPEQQHSRVENAVARFLSNALIVPKIFFEAQWPSRQSRVDVLAVDRAGAGEIHVVQVKVGGGDLVRSLRFMTDIPAHFKYLALFQNGKRVPAERDLYSANGMGRVGILQVRQDQASDLQVEFLIRPERFRLDSSFFRQIDRFTTNRPADIEIRP
jgi:hypothetical protein